MSAFVRKPADTYSPLYFLGSLGAGGVVVTFFMYLMFWVPHPDRPVPIFEDIASAWASGGIALQVAIALAMSGIALFAALNFKHLIWNLTSFARFKQTDAYAKLMATNAEAATLAMPLALAMTINVGFILGLAFVPRLWGVVEYLFPVAMIAFALTGLLALAQVGRYLGRIFGEGGFDMAQHNSFAQVMPAFALAMVGVGFAAPSAMSGSALTVGMSFLLSTFFLTIAVIYALVAVVTGVVAMLQHGAARESAPTLMVIVPLVTVLGILMMRQTHGLHTTFGVHGGSGETLAFLTRMISIQLVFIGLGMAVLLRQRYFDDFVLGARASAGSYALVCPAVAFEVMMFFFIHKGLVANGVIEKFSAGYWAVTAIALASQAIAILLVFRLNRQHFSDRKVGAVAAE